MTHKTREIIRDDTETVTHPKIVAFLELYEGARANGSVTLDVIQSRPFMGYWPFLILHRWDEEKQDFLYSFWGSSLVDIYGMDLTGKYILRGDYPDTEGPFHRAHHDVMTRGEPVYIRSSMFWINKDYREVNAVILPMIHRNLDPGTISYLTFQEAPSH